MKVAMPRSIMPPMLFALAVKSDHMFASRWPNTQLDHVDHSVDQKISTLDGKGTFHGMGLILAISNKVHIIAKQSMRLCPNTKVNELV